MTSKKGSATEGALSGVKIVDLTDERAIYGAKLLADLGADVVRPEPPEGDPLRQRGPHDERAGRGQQSLWHAFFGSSRHTLPLDPADSRSRATLAELLADADLVLTCDHAWAREIADLGAARTRQPRLVHIAVTSFGKDNPWQDFRAPDLVAGALGGAVATTGLPETTPIKTFGELNFMVSGVYAAIAALAGLAHARATGEGQRVDVPVHECIASCLEQVFMMYWYGERAMGRGRVLPRQGGVHWSMAYVVMPARDGAIMITPAPDFDAQLAWLIEEDAHQDLLDPKYALPENQPLYIARMMQVLREWVQDQDPEALFFKAQDRHAPYGWVLPIERLADNPQLEARNWWVPYQVGEHAVAGPGAPYHFSATPWQHRDPEIVSPDNVLDLLGWSNPR